MSAPLLKKHMAMWPGLVGKSSQGGTESDISLERMLELTANARGPNKERFDGVDLFLFHPHIDPDASDDDIKYIASCIAGKKLWVGSLVAPVWQGTVGDCAFGTPEQRAKFISAIKKACRIAKILNEFGIRKRGIIRVDSAGNPAAYNLNPTVNGKNLEATLREAAIVAAGFGERLAAEGEIVWGGMNTLERMVRTLEGVNMPGTLGFQADLAHTFGYLLGIGDDTSNAFLKEGYTKDEFDAAYAQMADALRPWTIDFHVAQNDGTVHGSGSHEATSRHCMVDDPNGKLDIVEASKHWLQGAASRGVTHVCWDGCMFPNAVLEDQETYNKILAKMVEVVNANPLN